MVSQTQRVGAASVPALARALRRVPHQRQSPGADHAQGACMSAAQKGEEMMMGKLKVGARQLTRDAAMFACAARHASWAAHRARCHVLRLQRSPDTRRARSLPRRPAAARGVGPAALTSTRPPPLPSRHSTQAIINDPNMLERPLKMAFDHFDKDKSG